MELLHPTLVALGSLLLTYLGLRVKLFMDMKMSRDRQDQVLEIIRASVNFVEQITHDDNFVGDKLVLAKNRARAILTGSGFEITEEELETWIESFVLQLGGK